MDPDVIAPNLKRRLSEVTATVVRLVPIQARQMAGGVAARAHVLAQHRIEGEADAICAVYRRLLA